MWSLISIQATVARERVGGMEAWEVAQQTVRSRCLEHEEPPKQGCTQVDQSDVVVV